MKTLKTENRQIIFFTAIMITAFNILLIFSIYSNISFMLTKPNSQKAHYILEMHDDGIKIIDPDTDKLIYSESYDSDNEIIDALLKDNE